MTSNQHVRAEWMGIARDVAASNVAVTSLIPEY